MANFCDKCGSRLDENGNCPRCTAEISGQNTGKKSPLVIILSVVLAVLILIGSIIPLSYFDVINIPGISDIYRNKNRFDSIYSSVIDQYINAKKNGFSNDGNFINSILLNHAKETGNFDVFFALSDLNGDGFKELVVSAGETIEKARIYDVFTNNGKKVSNLFNDRIIGEKSKLNIYDNGIIHIGTDADDGKYYDEYFELPDKADKPEFILGLGTDNDKHYEVDEDLEIKNEITDDMYEDKKSEVESEDKELDWVESEDVKINNNESDENESSDPVKINYSYSQLEELKELAIAYSSSSLFVRDAIFNREFKNAFTNAMSYIMPPQGVDVYNYYNGLLNWNSEVYTEYCDEWNPEDISTRNDPLKKLSGYGYKSYDGDNVDWILSNVFGLEPDHGFESDNIYYYDGNYYVATGDGADPFYDIATINGYETVADEKCMFYILLEISYASRKQGCKIEAEYNEEGYWEIYSFEFRLDPEEVNVDFDSDDVVYSDIDSLSYEMKEKRFDGYTDDGVHFSSEFFNYPYFTDGSPMAEMLNDKYNYMISQTEKIYNGDMQKLYEEHYSYGYYLPVTQGWDISVEYNDNGYISLKEYFNSNGSEGGGDDDCIYVTYEINTLKEMKYSDFFEGTTAEAYETVLYYTYETYENATKEAFNLDEFIITDNGIEFQTLQYSEWYNEKIIVPFTDTENCRVSCQQVLYPEFSSELTDAQAEKLWNVANFQYCLWFYWREETGYVDEFEDVDIKNDGYPYFLVTYDEIDTVKELDEHLSYYFSETTRHEIYDEWGGFLDYNGSLYARSLAIGTDFGSVERIYVKEQNGNTAVLTIETSDPHFDENSYTDMNVSYVDGRWIFTDEYFCYSY